MPPLIELLESEDESDAKFASTALVQVRIGTHLVPALAKVVSTGSETVVQRAVSLLHRMERSATAAVPTLLDIAGSEARSDALRIAAARAALEIDPTTRDAKAVLSTVPALIRVLKHGSFQDQGWAAELAGKIGPPAREALPHLRERLWLPDADADIDGLPRNYVATEAAKAITSIEVPEVWETMP